MLVSSAHVKDSCQHSFEPCSVLLIVLSYRCYLEMFLRKLKRMNENERNAHDGMSLLSRDAR